jgi:hypothetical protein
MSEQNSIPPTKTPLSRLGSWFATAVGIVIAAAIGLVALVWFLPLLPILAFAGLVVGLAVLFALEGSPYPASRFAIALVSGVLADRIIFWVATSERLYRPAGAPTIYALSIACGYAVWRLLSPSILKNDDKVHGMPAVAGIVVAIPTFLIASLVLSHFFPWLHDATSWYAQFDAGDN